MIFDLIAAHQPSAGSSVWTPADLFKNGEVGAWFDASDYSTMFQDSAGTIPVTDVGQFVARWDVKVGSTLFNLTQSSTSGKPITVLNSGKPYVRYDGVNDMLSTGESGNVSPSGAVTLAVGQKRTSNPGTSVKVAMFSGTQETSLKNQTNGTVLATAGGGTVASAATISLTAPNVLMLYAAAGTVPLTVRVNGVSSANTTNPTFVSVSYSASIVGDFTTGGDISQLVIVNRLLTPAEITLLETYIAGKQ